MKFKVRRQGIDLGFLSLEEVRRRRGTGEFTGNEYVQSDGATDWQPLDQVLQQGYQATPPQVPKQAIRSGPNPWLLAGAILLSLLMFGFLIFFGIRTGVRASQKAYTGSQRFGQHQGQPAIAQAKVPIVWTTNTLTEADWARRERALSTRLWLDDYKQRGQRNSECDAAVVSFLQTWIAHDYRDSTATNKNFLANESKKLAADTNCTDPLALIAIGDCCQDASMATNCYVRALAAYATSRHPAYPQIYADIRLREKLNASSTEAKVLEQSILQTLPKIFTDGSFTPDDQPEIARFLTSGWDDNFYLFQIPAAVRVVHAAGPDYRWLALVLDGTCEIEKSEKAYTKDNAADAFNQSWDDYYADLDAAGRDFTAAWKLKPQWPLAAERMVYVSLCNSGIDEMRVWFDRATALQIDDRDAWQDFRWGLGSAWYGNQTSLLAFGVAAVDTGRFDTDVPRKYIDCIGDVESELKLPAGHHIYGRADIWPNLEKMYGGYISSPAQQTDRDSWRTSFAIAAYSAGKYDEARTQLEALNWNPSPSMLADWGTNLSEMSLEVAARTGSLGAKISAAEVLFHNGDSIGARKKYLELADENPDARTRQFIELRITKLTTLGL